MKMSFAMELTSISNSYGTPPLLSIQIQEQVPKEREHDAVVYLRERINEEFRRVTGSPAVREYANALITAPFSPWTAQQFPQYEVSDQFTDASGDVDGSEHW